MDDSKKVPRNTFAAISQSPDMNQKPWIILFGVLCVSRVEG